MPKLKPRTNPVGGAHRYVTVNQAADYLCTTTRTIYNMLEDGRLTGYRGLGSRMLRIDMNEVDAVMAGGPA